MEPISSAPASLPGCSKDSLIASLQEILSEPVSRVEEREKTAFDRLLTARSNRCVLFGAGNMGQRALAALRSVAIEPLAISDNNQRLWGSEIDGIPLLSPVEAAARFGKDAVFFITIRNEQHWYRETFEQLTCLGCATVSSAAPLGWRFADQLLPVLLYDLPHKLYPQAGQVLAAANLWQDDASRAEYLVQIRLRALGDSMGLQQPIPESYFVNGVFDVEPSDAILDCGAFDGDTIQSILARQPEVGRIDAIEADSNSFAKLQSYVATLEAGLQKRIHIHKCAVGSHRGTVRFEDSGTLGSKISDSGSTAIDLVPIDELCATKAVSMIKMDIEGGEHDALVGAHHVIQRDRPILAICVYHCQEDLWRLPLLMRSLCPDYCMYLRAYRGDGIQTVAYAVPPERLRSE